MRNRNLTAVVGLMSVLVVAPVHALEKSETTLQAEEPIPAGGSVSLENLIGSITIRGGGAPGVVGVEARVVAEAKTADEARVLAESVRLERREGENGPLIHVGYPVDAHVGFRLPKSEGDGVLSKWVVPLFRKKSVAAVYDGRTVSLGESKGSVALAVHLSVTLPSDIDSAIRQFLGSVQCKVLKGNLELENVEGRVVVGRIYGTLQARTGGGDLSVSTAKGERVDLQTASGTVQLMDVSTDELRLQTGSGAIQGRAIKAGAMTIQAESGPIALDDVDSRSSRVTTGSGNVDLAMRLQRAREAVIRSASGDVTLRLGDLAPFDLQIQTEKGSVKSRHASIKVSQETQQVARASRGTGGADLQVTTGSGEVILRAQ